MRQNQINKAYPAIGRLLHMKLPVKVAYQILSLANQIQVYCDSAKGKEVELATKHGGTISSDGRYAFENEESAEGFRADVISLNNSEVDIENVPVVIDMDAIGDQTISPMDIILLDGLVVFNHGHRR